MIVNPVDFSYDDIISLLENPFVRSLPPIDYGKAVQTAVEEYVSYNINLITNEEILIDVKKYPELIKEFSYSNNGPGFDRLFVPTKKKIQVKLRQTDGKTPYSKQVHFENTRRISEKNQNISASTGHVRYSTSEFDYVLVVLCHIVDGERKKHNEWSYSLVSSSQLEDVNTKGYCLPNIPSSLLLENKFDNIYELANHFTKNLKKCTTSIL